MVFLAAAVCSVLQLGCSPDSIEPIKTVQVDSTYGVECQIDLSSLNTPERMGYFTLELQKFLQKAQGQICRFYEMLEIRKPLPGKVGDDFVTEFLPLNEYQIIRNLINGSRMLQQSVAMNIIDTVYIVLKAQHPEKLDKCAESTKKMLKNALLKQNGDSLIYPFTNNEPCGTFYGYNSAIAVFFKVTSGYVGHDITITRD